MLRSSDVVMLCKDMKLDLMLMDSSVVLRIWCGQLTFFHVSHCQMAIH